MLRILLDIAGNGLGAEQTAALNLVGIGGVAEVNAFENCTAALTSQKGVRRSAHPSRKKLFDLVMTRGTHR